MSYFFLAGYQVYGHRMSLHIRDILLISCLIYQTLIGWLHETGFISVSSVSSDATAAIGHVQRVLERQLLLVFYKKFDQIWNLILYFISKVRKHKDYYNYWIQQYLVNFIYALAENNRLNMNRESISVHRLKWINNVSPALQHTVLFVNTHSQHL